MNVAELPILDFIQQNMAGGILDPIMIFITHLGDAGILWILASIILLCFPKTRKIGGAIALSLVVEALICNVALKPLIARTRPYDVNEAMKSLLLIKAPTDYSFPSGHTGAAFATVGALFFIKCKAWIPTAILSALIAFSRMYLYVHYPTDVLCGLLLGVASAYVGCKLLEWLTPKLASKFGKKNK